MESHSSNRIGPGYTLALLLVVISAIVSHVTLNNLVGAYQLVAESERKIRLLVELRAAVVDAEIDQREFIVTGEERFLEAYLHTRPSITARLKELSRLIAVEAGQSERLIELGNTIDRRFESLNEAIAIRKDRGTQVATPLVRNDQGKVLMTRIKTMVEALQNQQEVLRATRVNDAEINANLRSLTNILSTAIMLCVFGGLLLLARREEATRRESGAARSKASADLESRLTALQQRHHEATVLGQMSSFLQTCASSDEAYAAIARFGPVLFPGESGVVYLFNNSHNHVDPVASWGSRRGDTTREETFSSADCWALRRGRMHVSGADESSMACAHIAHAPGKIARPGVCMPMIAQGAASGLLFLQARDVDAATLSAARLEFIASVAEQMALALFNISLREALRQQSVRDPLTGLYNRRFLEETLDRELSRLERKTLPLSLIMLDIDNFKAFNDTFGHAAGDAVLRDLGSVLQRFVRGGDIACRYGGEEFTVILPEASLEIGRQRAEMLREAAREMRIVHDGKALGSVTLSLGVACSPEHTRSRDQLLQMADAALYEAKSGGRNRVVVSGVKTLKVVETPLQRDLAGH